MTYSIKQLNKAAAAHDLELVKGSGYFYWVHPTQFPPSVYVNSFNECTKEMWLEELAAAADSYVDPSVLELFLPRLARRA
jgi:hypothetical protein